MKQGHIIEEVLPESIAEELGVVSGDSLLAINGKEISDVFDYQYLCEEEEINVLIKKADGEEWLLEVEKDADEDLGLVFGSGLMDEYRSCRNHCIFCFIDQMPKGMRKTLYFKDDDARLSFLQGNYITLTNLSEKDIERIITYRMSPVNISVHTTDPELRVQMLRNKTAGDSLAIIERLFDAGITMNGQIVLCKGINDGKALEKTLQDLSGYLPHMQSLSVVPVGITKYREKLYPLTPFTKEDALQVLELVHGFQDALFAKEGNHFVHASDEWYLLAGKELPEGESYDGYPQLENGVGMLRLLMDEVREEIEERKKEGQPPLEKPRRISIGTGLLAEETIRGLSSELMALYPKLGISVFPVRNDFFGEKITVSGLLTGQDILKALKGKELGEALFLPSNVLRAGEDVFLDDMTLEELADSLQLPVHIVESNGYDFVEKLVGSGI
ncbi:MAG: DUF512 domain-containing protein [Lachnospiraceae bacterium]|nr:DUF512 domain-containing protein [Lachnospiraceae bacterium]